MTQPTCDACKTQMPLSNLLLSWPGWIVCRRCRAANTVPFGPVVGAVYVVALFSVIVLVVGSAGRFGDGIARTLVELSAPVVAMALVGSLYLLLVRSVLPLRAKTRDG